MLIVLTIARFILQNYGLVVFLLKKKIKRISERSLSLVMFIIHGNLDMKTMVHILPQFGIRVVKTA